MSEKFDLAGGRGCLFVNNLEGVMVQVVTIEPSGDSTEVDMTPDEARAYAARIVEMANSIQPEFVSVSLNLPVVIAREVDEVVHTDEEMDFFTLFVVKYVELCECDADGAARIFLKHKGAIDSKVMIGEGPEAVAEWIAGIETGPSFGG